MDLMCRLNCSAVKRSQFVMECWGLERSSSVYCFCIRWWHNDINQYRRQMITRTITHKARDRNWHYFVRWETLSQKRKKKKEKWKLEVCLCASDWCEMKLLFKCVLQFTIKPFRPHIFRIRINFSWFRLKRKCFHLINHNDRFDRYYSLEMIIIRYFNIQMCSFWSWLRQ